MIVQTDFLKVARKCGYHCAYIFHFIFLEKDILNKNLLKTNIFRIFLASVPFQTIAKVLQYNVVRVTKKYLPAKSLWINTPFIELANGNEMICITIDCSGVNIIGPGRIITKADNQDEEVCYFIAQNDDRCLMFSYIKE